MNEILKVMPQKGKIDWIGIRPQKKGEVKPVSEVYISQTTGLDGDHYNSTSQKRAVTLIQAEHIITVASVLKKEVLPTSLRRNIVVSGINLLAFKDRQFKLGNEVILEFTGYCHPCKRMEENLGAGGYNAMNGHGGITCKVIKSGTIKLEDEVVLFTTNQ